MFLSACSRDYTRRSDTRVLSEVLVIVGVGDGLRWIPVTQSRAIGFTKCDVFGAAALEEMGSLVDQPSCLGILTNEVQFPEDRTDVDASGSVDICSGDLSVTEQRSLD